MFYVEIILILSKKNAMRVGRCDVCIILENYRKMGFQFSLLSCYGIMSFCCCCCCLYSVHVQRTLLQIKLSIFSFFFFIVSLALPYLNRLCFFFVCFPSWIVLFYMRKIVKTRSENNPLYFFFILKKSNFHHGKISIFFI